MGMKFDIGDFAKTLGTVSESDTSLQMISLALLDPNKRNFYPPVKEFDSLVESIQANGLIEPLTVVPSDSGRYRLISGHNRLRALRHLHDADGSSGRWDYVPCLVLPAMSDAQERCAVIEGNRQRVKVGALLAEEARQLTAAYVERKKAGEEFRGRIRDRVAEALQVSATKIATVQAIENNLKVPGFLEQWKRGEASESVLYEISKLPKDAQLHLWDEQCDGRILTAAYAKMFSAMWSGCCHECPHTGKFCENAEKMVRFRSSGDDFLCAGCCEQCRDKGFCGSKCQYIPEPESVIKFRAEQAAKHEAEAAERAEKARRYNEAGRDAWKRLVDAAESCCTSFANVLRALGWADPDLRDVIEMEKRARGEIFGEGDETALFVHPFEDCSVDEMNAVADLLCVSIDWILGREKPLLPAWPCEGQLHLAAWMPGGTFPAHDCPVVLEFAISESKVVQRLGRFNAAARRFELNRGDAVEMEPIRWIELPE